MKKIVSYIVMIIIVIFMLTSCNLVIISEDELFEYELKVSITTAKAQNDKLWLLALKNLKKERKARDK